MVAFFLHAPFCIRSSRLLLDAVMSEDYDVHTVILFLYQRDNIPTEILSERINKLYNEKTALQASVKPEVKPVDAMPFDLA